jgi:hypothetical protein
MTSWIYFSAADRVILCAASPQRSGQARPFGPGPGGEGGPAIGHSDMDRLVAPTGAVVFEAAGRVG